MLAPIHNIYARHTACTMKENVENDMVSALKKKFLNWMNTGQCKLLRNYYLQLPLIAYSLSNKPLTYINILLPTIL